MRQAEGISGALKKVPNTGNSGIESSRKVREDFRET